jgi:long-chain acyl-CoA synthetase
MSQIISMLSQSFAVNATKPALIRKQSGRWVESSYAAVWKASDRVASGLHEWGLEAGQRAALIGASTPDWVIVYLGILKANGVAVPIDKELKRVELRHILADCGARLVFVDQALLEQLCDIAAELPELERIVVLNGALERDADALPPRALNALAELVDEWQRLSARYGISGKDQQHFAELAENFRSALLPGSDSTRTPAGSFFSRILSLRDKNRERPEVISLKEHKSDASPPNATVAPTDPAVIIYTSGTTGRSKGAMLSHANIASNVRGAIELFELDADIHTLSFLPINHVFEQVAGIILPLATGGSITFAESLRRLGDNLGEVRPNFLLGVPAVFRLLVDRMTQQIDKKVVTRTLFNLRLTRSLVTRKVREAFGGNPIFISGGAALDPVVAARLMAMGLNVFQGYGITETSPVIAVETPKARRLGSVGRPMPGVEVKIHRPNAEGVGEIWAKGPNIMLGYFNNPAATAEVLTDGWYHTGDLGRIDEDGFLWICGRLKNLIVTANGKNVYPEEIENELSNSPFIAEIMVYGHKLDATAEEVHAIIFPDQEALDQRAADEGREPYSPTEVEEIIRNEVLERGRQLADYKRIRRFTLREDEFPKTTTRKIKRYVVEADIDAIGPEDETG